ncbi:hypothetical protein FPQ18DRAFT_327729 [Pyronema domesticum]|nr:hypothetical protein FPQ18DRAFT_327729 [Pyronema domesticum]
MVLLLGIYFSDDSAALVVDWLRFLSSCEYKHGFGILGDLAFCSLLGIFPILRNIPALSISLSLLHTYLHQ